MAYNLFEGFVQDSWKMKPGLTAQLRCAHLPSSPWYDREGNGHRGVRLVEVR